MLDKIMLDKILKYQELDRDTLKAERELSESDAKKTMNNTVQIVKDAQNKSVLLDASAKALLAEHENLHKAFEDNFNKAQILYNRDLEKASEEDIKLFLTQISAINNNLSIIERKIAVQSQKLEEILKEFEDTKNAIMKARKLHMDSKEVYQKLIEMKEPAILKYKKQLADLETVIDKKVLEKYKTLKQDHIFPVFVPLNNTSCSGCGMQIPSSKLTMLKNAGVIECDNSNCRRMIYQKQ